MDTHNSAILLLRSALLQLCGIVAKRLYPLQIRLVDILNRLPAYPQVSGDRLYTHVAAQTADHAAEAACETTPFVNKLAVLQAPCVLADEHWANSISITQG